MTSDEIDNKIYLHTAKIITDKNGFIYDPVVLTHVLLNHIVRISFELDFDQISYWLHDAPYVKIIKKSEDNFLLGEVQNINRIPDTNNYPLMVGERIWFKLENIIEIPINLHNDNFQFQEFLSKSRVTATGPLYTIQSDAESDITTDSSSMSGSCSDSD